MGWVGGGVMRYHSVVWFLGRVQVGGFFLYMED